ncbi:hypothetical protein FACS1894191_6510 [Clostridia bacterium]|nr:hypothetical protein FACS1894191_6510 [Clostridia bacterium]
MTPEEKPKDHGPRNLALLGIGAVVVALTTSAISIIIYTSTGDIYLDRSRPGYLPDKEETEENKKNPSEETYTFPQTGDLTKKTLEDFLKKLDEETGKTLITDPFPETPLSDESLNLE